MMQESENPMKTTTIFGKSILRVVLLALCTTALSALPTMAQEPTASPSPQGGHGGPGQREEHQIEFLTKKLNLTPDQVTQVKAIDDDSRAQAMAVRNDSSVAQADKRAKMMDIHKASQDKIRAVLTDDQKTKYDALLAQMQERRANHEGGSGAPAPPPQ
jgi:periplasmic protein CpxP/Spy